MKELINRLTAQLNHFLNPETELNSIEQALAWAQPFYQLLCALLKPHRLPFEAQIELAEQLLPFTELALNARYQDKDAFNYLTGFYDRLLDECDQDADPVFKKLKDRVRRTLNRLLLKEKNEVFKNFPSHAPWTQDAFDSTNVYLLLKEYQGSLAEEIHLPEDEYSADTVLDIQYRMDELMVKFLYVECHSPLCTQLERALNETDERQSARCLNAVGLILNQALYTGQLTLAAQWLAYFTPLLFRHFEQMGPGMLAFYAQLGDYCARYATETPHAIYALHRHELDWVQKHEELKALRARLQAELPDTHALKAFNEAMLAFTQGLFKHTVSLAGANNEGGREGNGEAEYCLLLLGSLSRGQMTAYSDIECALVHNNPYLSNFTEFNSAYQRYLQTPSEYDEAAAQHLIQGRLIQKLFMLFEIYVTAFDELGTGYHLDEGCQPRFELHAIGTFAEYQRFFETEKGDEGLIYSMLHPAYLGGSTALFNRYQEWAGEYLTSYPDSANRSRYQEACVYRTALTRADNGTPLNWGAYWGRYQLARNAQKYETAKKQRALGVGADFVDLKTDYIKLLTFMLLDLSLFAGLPDHSLKEASDALVTAGYFSSPFAEAVLEAIYWLNTQRSRFHFEAGNQKDEVPLGFFNDEEQRYLWDIQSNLIGPFYESLPLFLEQGEQIFFQHLWRHQLQWHLEQRAPDKDCLNQGPHLLQQVATLELLGGHTPFLLPADWVETLFDETGHLRRADPDSNSAVFFQDGYCLKIAK